MSYNTAILQGRFTSTGLAETIVLRSDVDWMWVYNETILNDAALGVDRGAQFYWQRGMTQGRGIQYIKQGAQVNDPLTTAQLAANAGFFLIDSSVNVPGPAIALTALTAANPPVITTAGTLPNVGDIVVFNNLDNQRQIGDMDFTVTASGGGTFTIGNINLANSTPSTAGFFRVVPFDPIFYPRRRYITFISSEAQAKIYLSVTHNLTVGQQIRLNFPGGNAVWGVYAALDGVTATIVAVNVARAGNEPNNGGVANNIRVNLDTSALAAWNTFGAGANQGYPPSTAYPFSPAHIVPFGENTAQGLILNADILDDATVNTAFLGMRLAAGNNSPAGAVNDVIYWVAGKSFSVNNS